MNILLASCGRGPNLSCGIGDEPVFEGRLNSLGNAGLENQGLGYIASVAERHGSVKVVDLAFDPMGDQQIIDIIRSEKIGLVGISSMTWTTYEALDIARALRRAVPDVHLVVGGVGPTSIPHVYAEEFDYVITGEGEDAFEELLDSLCGNGPAAPRGIIRGQRNLHWNGMTYPYRSKELLMSGKLHMRGTCPIERSKQQPASIVGSRGCPNSCSFCMSEAMWGRQVVFRSPFEVVREIEYLVEDGYNCIDFLDLNLNLKAEWLLEICDLLIERGLSGKVALSGLWNPAITHRMEEIIAACAEAGFIMLSIGLENPDPALRDSMDKQKMESEGCYRVFELCLKHGITTRCLVILGSPGQDEQNVAMIQRELQDIKATEVRTSLHTIFPGTADWERYQHLLITRDWSRFDTGHQVLKSQLGDVEAVRLDLMRSFYNSQAYRDNRTELIGKRPAFEIGYKQLEGGFLKRYGLIEPGNCLA